MTDVQVENFNYVITSKKYEVETGHHLVTLYLTEISAYMEEVVIRAGCDNHWKHEPQGKTPESHLVKLRTDSDYRVHNIKGVLKS